MRPVTEYVLILFCLSSFILGRLIRTLIVIPDGPQGRSGTQGTGCEPLGPGSPLRCGRDGEKRWLRARLGLFVQGLEVLVAEGDAGGGDVVFQVGDLAGAGDGEH